VKGGIEKHLNLLCNGLKDRGVDVQVIVSNRGNKFEIDTFNGISIAKVPQWGRFYSAPLTPSFPLYLRAFGKDADIIHFHHPNPTAEFSYFFTNLKKKLIVTYHSDIIRQDKLGKLYSPFRRLFLLKADRIIATSPNYINTSAVLKNYKDKCTVIPLGIDPTRFFPNGDLSRVAKIRKENGRLPILLFVGCFRYYKGLHLLISAMESVQARLFLIGAGPEESNLRGIVEKKHLGEKIQFLGELTDIEVNSYYKACDIFVLPSHLRSEAFGMVQLEAMCCKKPVISTKLGTGTDFVNVNQQTGITVKAESVESLSKAINYLISHPDLRKRFGECGCRRVKEHFSVEKMVQNMLKLYSNVIAI
jgi:glycosyltransferase involved in cell wall biosynthesis